LSVSDPHGHRKHPRRPSDLLLTLRLVSDHEYMSSVQGDVKMNRQLRLAA